MSICRNANMSNSQHVNLRTCQNVNLHFSSIRHVVALSVFLLNMFIISRQGVVVGPQPKQSRIEPKPNINRIATGPKPGHRSHATEHRSLATEHRSLRLKAAMPQCVIKKRTHILASSNKSSNQSTNQKNNLIIHYKE